MHFEPSAGQEAGKPWIVVIGTSSGGGEALEQLAADLKPGLNACVLVVRHMSPAASAAHLAKRMQTRCPLVCSAAKEGAALMAGQIHVAQADHHLLVDESKIWVVRGARENRWRPAIDTLFRSAAVSHRSRTIGVLLTGYLDDGVAGLAAVKKCGGISVVQDPVDCDQPDLPQNALDRVDVDFCVPLSQLGDLLNRLVESEPAAPVPIPAEIEVEARISNHMAGGMAALQEWGIKSSQTCPDCGGVLWESKPGMPKTFRCHTGHAFASETLDAANLEKIDETLWVALRLFQEREALLQKMASSTSGITRESLNDRLQEVGGHIRRFQDLLGIH